MVLALVNLLALIYPIDLLLRGKSFEDNLFATFALIASVFLLASVDAISIVAADAVDAGKIPVGGKGSGRLDQSVSDEWGVHQR